LTGALGGPAIVAVALAIRLRRQGFDTQTIIRSLVEQPRWSRSWYPKRFRHRGDVWDRLPREYRQSRTYRGLFRVFVFTVFMPLWVITSLERRFPVLQLALMCGMLGGLALLYALGRRARNVISARLRIPPLDAIAIMNTPSWRVSAWRRPPASGLLANPSGATASPIAAAIDADSPTRI
jgi:hypothetical protein